MRQALASLLVVSAAVCSPAGGRHAQTARPPATRAAPVTEANPMAPPFKQGMTVVDRTGAKVGAVQSVTETPGGPNVVISVDGKLVGVAPTTLKLQGGAVVSSQTRAEILASVGAPP